MGNTDSFSVDDYSVQSNALIGGELSASQSNTSKRVKQMTNVQKEALELFKRKNNDYGDAFAEYGTIGVLIRLGDKIQRYVSVSNKGVALVDNEKLRDTLIDLANYASMAVMLMDEENSVLKDDTIVSQDSSDYDSVEVDDDDNDVE